MCHKLFCSSSWFDALAYCKNKRSTLVTIRSKEENEFLRNLTTRNVWIGMESRGVFRGMYPKVLGRRIFIILLSAIHIW